MSTDRHRDNMRRIIDRLARTDAPLTPQEMQSVASYLESLPSDAGSVKVCTECASLRSRVDELMASNDELSNRVASDVPASTETRLYIYDVRNPFSLAARLACGFILGPAIAAVVVLGLLIVLAAITNNTPTYR